MQTPRIAGPLSHELARHVFNWPFPSFSREYPFTRLARIFASLRTETKLPFPYTRASGSKISCHCTSVVMKSRYKGSSRAFAAQSRTFSLATESPDQIVRFRFLVLRLSSQDRGPISSLSGTSTPHYGTSSRRRDTEQSKTN